MKKEEAVDKQKIALEHQRKRRKNKIKLAVASVVLLLMSAILISTYSVLSKNEYNKYV